MKNHYSTVIIEGLDSQVTILHLAADTDTIIEALNNRYGNYPLAHKSKLEYQETIFVLKDCGYKRVSTNDIIYLEAQRNYCNIHLVRGNSYTVSVPMNEVYDDLNPCLFKRIHRSYIINMSHIDTYYGNMVVMTENVRIPISRDYKEIIANDFIRIGSRKRVKDKKEVRI